MNLNRQLGELLTLLGGQTTQDSTFHIQRISSLENAGPHDLAVVLDRGDQSVFDGVAKKKIEASQAGLVLAASPVVEGKHYLLVRDPLEAFTKLVSLAQQQHEQQKSATAVVDETAQVDSSVILEHHVIISRNAKIGKNTLIKAGAYIGEDVCIGEHVVIYPGVKILDGCVIGDYSIIHAGTVIGSDGFGYQVTAQGLRKIPQIGVVTVGKHVEIGANCTIDRASFNTTVIGDFVKMDNGVHIAHNVTIGVGTAILAQTGIAGSVTVGQACQIGGQVAIKDNVRIGNQVKIVSKSAVMNDLADGEVVAGIPARPFGQWKRTMVVLAKLPEMAKALKELTSLAEKFGKKESFIKRSLKKIGFSR